MARTDGGADCHRSSGEDASGEGGGSSGHGDGEGGDGKNGDGDGDESIAAKAMAGTGASSVAEMDKQDAERTPPRKDFTTDCGATGCMCCCMHGSTR